jgi:hypothetical protein
MQAHFDFERQRVFHALGHAPHLTGNYPMATVDDIPHADALENKSRACDHGRARDFHQRSKFSSTHIRRYTAQFLTPAQSNAR